MSRDMYNNTWQVVLYALYLHEINYQKCIFGYKKTVVSFTLHVKFYQAPESKATLALYLHCKQTVSLGQTRSLWHLVRMFVTLLILC